MGKQGAESITVKIAILGSRGIPVSYGGFETLAEELSTRLVSRGHDVTVYCCRPYSTISEDAYKGVRRVVLPTVRMKALEKPVFAFLSLLSCSIKDYDVVLMLGISVSSFCFIPRLFGKKVLINIDGLEWKRKKWGGIISALLKFHERMAAIATDRVVTDSIWVQEYYLRTYGRESIYIAYGANLVDQPPGPTLQKFGLQKGGYLLYVSRFEPENNALLVREIYDSIPNPSKKLVMVGDAPYADEYIRRVRRTQNPGVIFTGYQYGEAYTELLSNAYLYIQSTEVGGTHPALVEAMGAGNCVLANDVPEHREVLRDAGFYYSGREDLKSKMAFLMDDEAAVNGRKLAVLEIVRKEYSWDKISDAYEREFLKLVQR